MNASDSEAVGHDTHMPELDGIRALAILSVLAMHLMVVTPHGMHVATGLPRGVEVLLGHGWLGVDLFFPLSGFLITRILLRTRDGTRKTYFKEFHVVWIERIDVVQPRCRPA